VDRLEEAGLVVRVPHATDRRIWMVQLTPTGLKMVRESRSSSASAAVNNLIAQFDLDDWGKLLSMLKQIDEALSHQ
jgi:DNA-binding MarR family transcriptional regulator